MRRPPVAATATEKAELHLEFGVKKVIISALRLPPVAATAAEEAERQRKHSVNQVINFAVPEDTVTPSMGVHEQLGIVAGLLVIRAVSSTR